MDPYLVYLRTYGKLASMQKLTDGDYGTMKDDGAFEGHRAEIQVATSLAAQDVSLGEKMRAKVEFMEELGRLLG